MKKTPQDKVNRIYLQVVLDHIFDEDATEQRIIDKLHEVGFIQGVRPGRLPKDDLENFLWRLVYYMHNYDVCNVDEAVTINWDMYLRLVADLIFQSHRNDQNVDAMREYANLYLEFIDLYYLGGHPTFALISLYQHTTSKRNALRMAKTFIPHDDFGWVAEFIMSLPIIEENLLIS